MPAFLKRAVIVSSALLMAATVSAQTQGLERVGPTSTSNGYPTWYQDKTGLTLEFCQVTNQAELDGGWCLLLPADTTAPEAFPAPFADEHFFWAGDAIITNGPFSAKLVLGLEGAFAVGPVINGDQVVFARVRVVFDAPATGTYTVLHPYGTETLEGVAGQRVFFTRDIGIACAGGGTAFECALRGDIGPFLLASATPGGAELAAVLGPVPGKLYIADPARIGPVTGSPFNQNFFRIVGPGGTIIGETNDFALMGRVFQGVMPGRMTVDRARYARDAGNLTGKTDVFASAFGTAQPRLPAAPVTAAVTPMLGFYPAACSVGAGGALGAPAGITPVQMFSSGSRHYGQTEGVIPAAVCVQDLTARDANGQAISVYSQATVTDQVTISEALYNPAAGGTLTVTATSSDLNTQPVLTALGVGSFTSGASVSGIVGVPPLVVAVTSAAGGRAELEVSTLVGQPDFPAVPFAGNDAFAVAEDSGANTLSVLANDTMGGAVIDPITATIAIVQHPALGNATVVGGAIAFTPTANANGNDQLAYTVTVAGATSLPAFVSIAITNVNDAPIANDDAPNGVGSLGISINLLANDTDVDGAADLVGAVIVSAPAGITYTLAGGVLTFTAPAGTHTFLYQAADVAGALSNQATVTVTLTGGETLAITRAEYIQSKRRWRVQGTSTVIATQTVYIMYADGTFADGTPAVGTLVGTAQVDPAGLWALDLALAGANDPRNPTSTLFSVSPLRIYAITTLGGSSPQTTFIVR